LKTRRGNERGPKGRSPARLRGLLKKLGDVEFVLAEVTDLDAAGRMVTARRPMGRKSSSATTT